MTEPNRLAGSLDAVLHLLDRQVADVEGRLVCKVDDLEVTDVEGGGFAVSALLSGPAVLVPRLADGRLGRRLHDQWRRFGEPHLDHDDPYRIDLALVEHLGSGVELKVPRDGVLVRTGQRVRRLNDLLQMTVQQPDGVTLGRVLDVRLENQVEAGRESLRAVGLLVGRGRPGSYLWYDRRPDMGPRLVAAIVRYVHRHTTFVDMQDVQDLDWSAGIVRVRARRPSPARS
jgi:sporulation protein YlmC with PRC-barrel domain